MGSIAWFDVGALRAPTIIHQENRQGYRQRYVPVISTVNMRVKDFKDMSDEELLQQADECFIDIEKSDSWQEMHTAKLLRAQLFMNELDRRDNSRVAARDFKMARQSFWMEFWVIVLIGLELIIAVAGLWYGIDEGNKQAKILDHMDQSTAATADILKTQGKILKTMNKNTADTVTAMQKLQVQQNDSLTAQQNSLATLRNTLSSITKMEKALEQELNLAFDVSVAVTTNNTARHISIVNQGKTAISVWGGKLNVEQPTKFDSPKFVAPGTQVEFFLEDAFAHLALLVPKGSKQTFPLEFYVLSADGKPYVIRGVVSGMWEKDQFNLYSTIASIKQEGWPKEVQ